MEIDMQMSKFLVYLFLTKAKLHIVISFLLINLALLLKEMSSPTTNPPLLALSEAFDCLEQQGCRTVYAL